MLQRHFLFPTAGRLAAFAALVILSGCTIVTAPASMLKPPAFRPWPGDPKQIGPTLNGYSQATVPKDGLIVVEGDDLAYGTDAHGRGAPINEATVKRSAAPFPETLSKLLGVRVENRGYPGDTIAQGAARWAGRPYGNLLIIAYGYGDAKAKTSRNDYAAELKRMITDSQSHGAAVILLVAPAYLDKALTARAENSRGPMREAQSVYGTNLFEGAKIVSDAGAKVTRGDEQPQKVYSAIAYTLAPYIAVAPPRDGRP